MRGPRSGGPERPQPDDDVPIMLLQRFGVLLAVNFAATSGDPSLPVADASERAVAQRIAAQAGISL